MDRLPKVYVNKISKKICNEQALYRNADNNDSSNSLKDINKIIDEIFHDRSHVYKSRVRVTLKNMEKVCDIVGKRDDYLLTLDNDSIRISDIINIKKI